jgi:hypothetical protein
MSDQCVGERGERGERVSFPYAYAHTRAIEDLGRRSPRSLRFPTPGNHSAFGGERHGERAEPRSPAGNGTPRGHWEELI